MGNLGEKVWYQCPECNEEKWAHELFVGHKCWKCMGNQEIADQTNAEVKKVDPDFFNRRAKFVTMSENGKPLYPKSTYKYSNFRVLYKQMSKDNLTDDMILNLLKEEQSSLISTYNNAKYKTIGQKCVKLWTAASPFYKKLTNMLIYDDYVMLKKYMPIIRGITSELVQPTNRKMTTYRGSKILIKQFDGIKVGNTYRIPQILATSESKNVAQGFLEGSGVMITFSIPKGCYNAWPIAKYSALPNEQEVLFPPYTAIKVISKSKYNKTIDVEVIDNMFADRNAPSRIM